VRAVLDDVFTRSIGRLVKASSKRTSRDSVLGVSLSSSSAIVQDPNSSATTLGNAPAGGGNVKLSHAQGELQACEAHLALKEQDLERVRVRAVIGGLQRRCTALVECGWIWGEKGKEALRALETSSLNVNEDEKAPNGISEWAFLKGNLYRRLFTQRKPLGSSHVLYWLWLSYVIVSVLD
jgi:hypothetical protein